MSKNEASIAERGNAVAIAVWEWLQREKAVQFVPWVLDKSGTAYDPTKAARQAERTSLLNNLERLILTLSDSMKE